MAERTASFQNAVGIRVAPSQKALLVEVPGKGQLWVPQSVIDEDSEVWKADQTGTLVLKLWFAENRGLVQPRSAREREEDDSEDRWRR